MSNPKNTKSTDERLVVVEMTQLGQAVLLAKIDGAVNTHTDFVYNATEAVNALVERFDESDLFDLLPQVARAAGEASAAAKTGATSAAAAHKAVVLSHDAVKALAADVAERALPAIVAGANAADATKRVAKELAEAHGQVTGELKGTREDVAALAAAIGEAAKAGRAERAAAAKEFAAIVERVERVEAAVESVKTDARQAREAAERVAAAAEAQASSLAAVLSGQGQLARWLKELGAAIGADVGRGDRTTDPSPGPAEANASTP